MTPEEQAETLLRAILDAETLNERLEAAVIAIKAGMRAERQRCMAAMCEGCLEGWEDHPREGGAWHKKTIGTSFAMVRCTAQPIRDMSDDG